MTIVWGILCLGLIVFVHELGHFIVARICGVTVESFSIGMGPVVFHKTIHGTDYRISLLPFGGYCGMKGEQAFQHALEQKLDAIPKEEGSFYGIHPLKRALIALAGPTTNLLFAVIAFTIIAMTGYTYYSADNRVIMADEVYKDVNSAAHVAGLKTGDKITAIDGEPIENFSEISRLVSLSPEKPLEITVTRDGMQQSFTVIPELDSSTGSGKIGVMNWIDPIVANVVQESPAHKAGIMVGDRITSVDGIQTENTADIQKHLEGKTSVVIGIERILPEGHLGTQLDIEVQVEPNESLGLQFSVPAHEARRFSFFPAIIQGFKETGKLIALTFKSIGLLFKGVDLSQAVSGPVRITVMLGDTVQSGFSAGFKTGFVSTMNFLALISVSLFIMNLLPIPILDGGIILFAVIEAIRRKPVHPKAMYYSQFVGIAFIVLLFGLALFSDANYLIKDVLRR